MRVNGEQLTLMMGAAVPRPVPRPVLDALQSVEVYSGGDRSGFQLTFTMGKKSALQLALLPAGFFDPITTRVIIVVTLNGIPHVLVDGFITRQDMSPSSEAGKSTLTVTGEDLTVAMDLVQMTTPYPSMSHQAQVNAILGKYGRLGITPVVIPPFISSTRSPTDGHETQTETDLDRLRFLASENGYVFYIEPGPLPTRSIGYFGPDIRVPVPQPSLSVNMDAHTNVDSLTFSLDGLKSRLDVITILDPVTGRVPITVPMPQINAFKPPLGARPLPPAKIVFGRNSGTQEFEAAIRGAVGRGIASSGSVTGNGALSTVRYGHILRSRSLVGVRGAGLAYDGLYYVDSVSHTIRPGEHKQSFTLSRDGLVSNTPVVMP